jgi:uncharacterized protein (UPF0303 family)
MSPEQAAPTEAAMAAIQVLIDTVKAQETELVLTRFDNTDAWTLGTILVSLAQERGLAVTVDITRGQQQLFHAAMPGTAAHNDVWIARKVTTVRELGMSSYLAGLMQKRGGKTFESQPWIDPLRFSGHGGSFPITVAGVGVVGTVTVSGLPQEADHALAVEAITVFLAQA